MMLSDVLSLALVNKSNAEQKYLLCFAPKTLNYSNVHCFIIDGFAVHRDT